MRYKHLDKFLEENFIPNNIEYKEISKDGVNISYEKYIKLYKISNLKLTDDEKNYVINYLKNKNIVVKGRTDKMNFESDDYIDVKNYGVSANPRTLSKEETLEKLKLYKKTKDSAIREEIILGNMRLVAYILKHMNYDYDINPYDLIQCGYEGLINAVDRFDLDKGVAFSTFASSYIIGYIKKGIYKIQGVRTTDIPMYSIMKDVEKKLGESVSENPSIAEKVVDEIVEQGLRSDSNKKENIRRIMLLNVASLEEILENNEDENIYNLGYETNDSDYNSIYDEEAFEIVKEAIKSLDEKKQKLIELRLGLNDDEPHTFAEIGKEIGMSGYGANLKFKSTCDELSRKKKVRSLKDYCYKEI